MLAYAVPMIVEVLKFTEAVAEVHLNMLPAMGI